MKKRILIYLAAVLLVFAGCTRHADNQNISDEERMEWWQEARFGMFIHWGIYSVPAGFYKGEAQVNSAEWIMNRGKIPIAEYEKYAEQFNPTEFDAKEFVGLAKEAGMKYMVITAKHHDGFSMFDSECSPYNIVDATPYGRDALKELAEECRKQGLKFGFYYSQAQDWHHPGGIGNNWDSTIARVSSDEYVREKVIPEVRQLLTDYGPIAIFWWDTPRKMSKEVVDSLYHMTTTLQPGIITNDRLGDEYPGDHETYERHIPPKAPDDPYWEVCMPISGSWGYRSDDQNFKSIPTLIRNLVDIASKGGNYLLNVSPTARGTLMPDATEGLRAMGQWMDVNGESIYGTQASPCAQPEWGRITMKTGKNKATLYLHVFEWSPGGKLPLRLNNTVEACYLLSDKIRTFSTERGDNGITVNLIGEAPDSVSSVIVMELAEMPEAIPTEFEKVKNSGDWNLRFSDSCTGSWEEKWFLDGQIATVENSDRGMNFSAGPVNRNDAHHAVLWTRESFTGDVKIQYNYTRTDTRKENVNILYIQATGIGEGPYAKDISQWNELRKIPSMNKYFRYMKALHISYSAFKMENEDPAADYIRVRQYPVTDEISFADTEIPPAFYETGLFRPGETCKITVIKDSSTLYFNVEGKRKEELFSWELDQDNPVTEGRIGLRHMYTRSANYNDFKVYVK